MSYNELFLNLVFGEKVDLNYNLLDDLCVSLKTIYKKNPIKPNDWRDPLFFPDESFSTSEISQYFTLGNSINFRYWSKNTDNSYNYCHGTKGAIQARGALYMWRCLKVSLDTGGFPLLDARQLSKISVDDMEKIFKDDNGFNVMPAMDERQKNWSDLGHKLVEYWDDEFYNLLKITKNSLFNFIRYSREFRCFDDPLCKMTMVNAILHKGRGIVDFQESIFPGIDYQLLKQQLRIGVLVPKGRLKDKILRNKILTAEEARELRNAGLRSFFIIMEKTSIPGDIIDNIFWLNGKKCNKHKPECSDCRFSETCRKEIDYDIPLELTRYY